MSVPFKRGKVRESHISCAVLFNKPINRVKKYQAMMHIDDWPLEMKNLEVAADTTQITYQNDSKQTLLRNLTHTKHKPTGKSLDVKQFLA